MFIALPLYCWLASGTISGKTCTAVELATDFPSGTLVLNQIYSQAIWLAKDDFSNRVARASNLPGSLFPKSAQTAGRKRRSHNTSFEAMPCTLLSPTKEYPTEGNTQTLGLSKARELVRSAEESKCLLGPSTNTRSHKSLPAMVATRAEEG